MSKAASKETLESLHAKLAGELAEAITEREIKIIDGPDGTPMVVKTRNAAVLNAARQFLKDNGVECAPGHPSKPVANLASKLPFTPDAAEEQTLQ